MAANRRNSGSTKESTASSLSTTYEVHRGRTYSPEVPKDAKGWLRRAWDVSHMLKQAKAKQHDGSLAYHVGTDLLKHSGLLKILGPTKYGGGEQDWDVACKVVRQLAQGDGSIGLLLGYHLLWSTIANLVGTLDQAEKWQEVIVKNNYFVGGVVNLQTADIERHGELKVTSEGNDIIYNGSKNSNMGGRVSDLLVLGGVLDGTDDHILAIVERRRSGIQFKHDLLNVGLRGTESGRVDVDKVHVPWKDALGWDVAIKKPLKNILMTNFRRLLLPTNFYLGVSEAALRSAPMDMPDEWELFIPSCRPREIDRFHELTQYRNFWAHLNGATAFADTVGARFATIYHEHGGAKRETMGASHLSRVINDVEALKIVTADTGLRITAGVFEVCGVVESSYPAVGLDRYWKDIRTHKLHDPSEYLDREDRTYIMTEEVPRPNWYRH